VDPEIGVGSRPADSLFRAVLARTDKSNGRAILQTSTPSANPTGTFF
jgi:hypothetical protein